MSRKSLLVMTSIALLAAGNVARADHYGYWDDPVVRLGVDVVWGGGYGYAQPAPPVRWYPAPGYGYDYGHGHHHSHHGHGHGWRGHEARYFGPPPRGNWDRDRDDDRERGGHRRHHRENWRDDSDD